MEALSHRSVPGTYTFRLTDGQAYRATVPSADQPTPITTLTGEVVYRAYSFLAFKGGQVVVSHDAGTVILGALEEVTPEV